MSECHLYKLCLAQHGASPNPPFADDDTAGYAFAKSPAGRLWTVDDWRFCPLSRPPLIHTPDPLCPAPAPLPTASRICLENFAAL
jgi:hypothetical protein